MCLANSLSLLSKGDEATDDGGEASLTGNRGDFQPQTSNNWKKHKAEIHAETVVLIYAALKELNATNHHMNLQGNPSLI